MNRFTGKVVLITGASSGIGEAAAHRFASEGAHVVVAARRLEQLREVARSIRGAGGTASVIQTDVTDPGSAEQAVSFAVDSGGGLDVVLRLTDRGQVVATGSVPKAISRSELVVEPTDTGFRCTFLVDV